VIALVLAAHAQSVAVPTIDTQRYRLPVDATATMWADDAGIAAGPSGRLAVGFLKEPLVWIAEDTGERVAVVDDVLGIDAIASFAAWRIRGAVDVPVYPLATGDVRSGGGLGDVAVDIKGMVLDRDDAPLGLALDARVTFPTATTAVSLGGGGVGWEVSAIVDKRVGPVLLAANVGTRGVPDGDLGGVAVSDAFVYRAGVGFAPGDVAGFSLDFAGQLAYSDLADPTGRTLEAMLGGWVRVAEPLTVRAGLGRGLLGGIGSPTARAVVAVAWQPPVGSRVARKVETVAARPLTRNEKAHAEFLVADSGRSAVPPGIVHIEVTGPDGAHVPATWAFGTAARGSLPAGVGSAKASPGPWSILVSAEGYGTQDLSVDVETGTTITVSAALRPARVRLSADRIVLLEKLRWSGAALDPASDPILDELAATLKAHPELSAVRVEAHAGGQGPDDDNLTLSGKRAYAVVSALTERGLDPARLVAVGRGEAFPLDRSDTPEAWAKNERVELVVSQRAP
jgi:flagellar motor protein MotB